MTILESALHEPEAPIQHSPWARGSKLAAEISDSVHESIRRAQLRLDPYPYFVASDLMPADFYKTAQHFAAERTDYAFPIPNGNGEVRIPPTRSFKNSPQLTDEASRFWAFFRDTVCAAVNEASVAKMRKEIDAYSHWLDSRGFLDRSGDLRFVNSALQVFRRSISSVDAHHHSLYELITNLIYMPPDASMAETGTHIDRMNGMIDVRFGRVFGLSRSNPYFFHDRADRLMTYDIVPHFMQKGEAMAQYLPNTLLSILNTPWSLHSQRVAHSGRPRYLLLFAALIERDQWSPTYQDTRKGGFELYADQIV